MACSDLAASSPICPAFLANLLYLAFQVIPSFPTFLGSWAGSRKPYSPIVVRVSIDILDDFQLVFPVGGVPEAGDEDGEEDGGGEEAEEEEHERHRPRHPPPTAPRHPLPSLPFSPHSTAKEGKGNSEEGAGLGLVGEEDEDGGVGGGGVGVGVVVGGGGGEAVRVALAGAEAGEGDGHGAGAARLRHQQPPVPSFPLPPSRLPEALAPPNELLTTAVK